MPVTKGARRDGLLDVVGSRGREADGINAAHENEDQEQNMCQRARVRAYKAPTPAEVYTRGRSRH